MGDRGCAAHGGQATLILLIQDQLFSSHLWRERENLHNELMYYTCTYHARRLCLHSKAAEAHTRPAAGRPLALFMTYVVSYLQKAEYKSLLSLVLVSIMCLAQSGRRPW